MFEYLLGAFILTNGGMIITLIVAIIKFSGEYGGLKKQVEVNTNGVRENGKRILDIERAL